MSIGHLSLNDSMSDKQFEEWLRDKGMTQNYGDRDKIIGMFSVAVIVCMYTFMCQACLETLSNAALDLLGRFACIYILYMWVW